MIYLRQSTASQEVPLGYFVDSTDGNTEETGLTIANTDIKIWKTGATTLANKNSGGATHISNGIYYAVLDATDTDTIGPLVIFVHVSGALAVRLECVVLDEAVYDVQFGTGTPATTTNITAGTITTATNVTTVNGLAANVITASAIASDAITAAKIADGAIDAATFAANAITSTVLAGDAITAAKVAADVGTEIGTAVWATGTRQLTGTQTFNLTGDITGNLSGSVGSVTAGVTVTTNNDKTGYRLSSTGVSDFLTSQITEAYRANGAAPTVAQFISEVLAHLGEATISGTTKTIKQFDHSTGAATFTLDDATNPSSITRAT